MPDQNDHDLIRDTAGRIGTLENKIKGFVPEQCIETRTNLINMNKNLESINANLKTVWVAILGMILTIVATTYINSQKPNVNAGAAQAMTRNK